jgi:hypothetical protein
LRRSVDRGEISPWRGCEICGSGSWWRC